LVPSRAAGQDGRVEPVGIRTDEVLLRPSRPSGTDAVDRAPQDPMTGLRPGVSRGTEQWTAALVPSHLAAPGHQVAPSVRRRAAGSGGDRPTPAAGPVIRRPPDERHIVAQLAAYREPDVLRWYGVVAGRVAG
jgi:hypothetical protein